MLASRPRLRPLCLAAWTLAFSAEQPPGRLPFRLAAAHGLTLTLKDLVRVSVRASRPTDKSQPFRASILPWDSSPFDAPSLRSPLPGGAFLPCCHGAPASPRRGFPHPLRSAFVVSHDHDGLPLLRPCDVFRPHTPMGFLFPSPRLVGPFGPAEAVPPVPGGRDPMREAPSRLPLWFAEAPLRCEATAPAAETAVPAPASLCVRLPTAGKPPSRFHGRLSRGPVDRSFPRPTAAIAKLLRAWRFGLASGIASPAWF
jgi:hypothetical protein